MMNRSTVPTLLGCLLALAAGVLASQWRHVVPGAEAAASTPTSSPMAPAPVLPASSPFTEAVRAATGARKWLLLASAAEHAKVQEMPALIRLAGEDSTAVRMIAARWAELDPKHMFTTLYADYLLPDGSPAALPGRWVLTDTLIEQWTKADGAGIVKVLNEVPSFSGLEQFRMRAVSSLTKIDVEQGLRAMKEWNITNYLPDLSKVAAWTARDPRHAAELAVQFGRDYTGREVLKEVGKAWAQTDPNGALSFASTLSPDLRAGLAQEVIRRWAGKDLAAAVKYAGAQDDPLFRSSLAQGLMSAWGKTDPAAALAWSQENLRGTARNEVIAGLVSTVAGNDLSAAADLVAGMEPGAAQNRATASIFETWFNKGKGEREAAFAWLSELPDADARRGALDQVQWQWVWNEPDAVRDFITGPHGALATDSMIQQVSRMLTSKNPESAMEWARKVPGDRVEVAKGAVLDSWLDVRPAGAAAYVRDLPAGDERDNAIQRVSQSLAYRSPQQAGEWYRSLSSDSQKLARSAFDRVGLNTEQRTALEKALAPPQ